MSAYLSRLVQRSLGRVPLVRPHTPAITAPDPAVGATDEWSLPEAVVAEVVPPALHRDVPSPPSPVEPFPDDGTATARPPPAAYPRDPVRAPDHSIDRAAEAAARPAAPLVPAQPPGALATPDGHAPVPAVEVVEPVPSMSPPRRPAAVPARPRPAPMARGDEEPATAEARGPVSWASIAPLVHGGTEALVPVTGDRDTLGLPASPSPNRPSPPVDRATLPPSARPRPLRRTEGPLSEVPANVVEVSIGRIEVRMPAPRATPSAPSRTSAPRAAVALGEYLRRRDQGGP